MSNESRLSKILSKHRVELGDLQTKSRAWFDNRVRDMHYVSQVPEASLMRGDQKSKGARILPGHLYMYVYDPKHKATLPYYDTFPLVFPFRAEKDGFYGINVHYLPYALRAKLMGRLLDLKNNERFDETTRLKLQWQFLSSSAKFSMVAPCVKHYLYSHVRSPFKAVHSTDWATAMLLPVEGFQKASIQEVWRDSMKIIKGV
jgi:hypothetical protein